MCLGSYTGKLSRHVKPATRLLSTWLRNSIFEGCGLSCDSYYMRITVIRRKLHREVMSNSLKKFLLLREEETTVGGGWWGNFENTVK